MIEFINEKIQEGWLDKLATSQDFHLSDNEAEWFAKAAETISPGMTFDWRGCLECKNAMVAFVLNNRDKLEPVKAEAEPETEEVSNG